MSHVDTLEFDAELRNCTPVYTTTDKFILVGAIYNDKRKRFNDGQMIRTTCIKSYEGDRVVATINTRYQISIHPNSLPLDVAKSMFEAFKIPPGDFNVR